MEAPDAPAVGSVIRLRIDESAESFTTWARLIYNRSGAGVGLRFIATAPDQSKILAGWLRGLRKV